VVSSGGNCGLFDTRVCSKAIEMDEIASRTVGLTNYR
jgi:hypothetical protein